MLSSRNWLLQRRGRVFACRSNDNGLIPILGSWDFLHPVTCSHVSDFKYRNQCLTAQLLNNVFNIMHF